MKCIVTAGPTYEELDTVRRMTNFSTGALGTELANTLDARGHDVTLLRGYYATCAIAPAMRRFQIFTTTADLNRRLEALASSEVHAVFHAAAVSDFAFARIWKRAADGSLKEIRSGKISTEEGAVLAELAPTPKIIARLRGWFPKALLVGWKYEVEGARAAALAQGHRQMEENRTDACVVNGPAYGTGFALVAADGSRHTSGKPALFKALLRFCKTGSSNWRKKPGKFLNRP